MILQNNKYHTWAALILLVLFCREKRFMEVDASEGGE